MKQYYRHADGRWSNLADYVEKQSWEPEPGGRWEEWAEDGQPDGDAWTETDLRHYEYEERIVAFIDILGWESIVENAIDNQEEINSLGKLLDEFEMYTSSIRYCFDNENLYPKYNQCDFTHFSDSIILSISTEHSSKDFSPEEQLQKMLISFMQCARVRGYVIRGGVTVGKIFHSGNKVFGPAVNRAYYLESKVAVYPRVILDPTILRNWNFKEKRLFSGENNDFSYWSIDQGDGTVYLNYIGKELELLLALTCPPNGGPIKSRGFRFYSCRKEPSYEILTLYRRPNHPVHSPPRQQRIHR